jgi:hypothetical protein
MSETYEILIGSDQMQADSIHAFLSTAYWCKGVPIEVLRNATKDAHTLYTPYGFTQLSDPKLVMEYWKPDIYSDPR